MEKIKSNFFVKFIRKNKYEKKFKHNKYLNLFKGVYRSFEEAQNHLPKNISQSYDNEQSAKMYKDYASKINSSDYPNLLWLSKFFDEDMKVFDLGGHIGIKQYAYKKFIDFPKNYNWTVHDMPAVMQEGQNFATQQNEKNIHFCENINGFDGFDILFCSGSLQYIDYNLGENLKQVNSKPKHILISIPLFEKETIYTINHIGTAATVYILRNRNEFINGILEAGYELVDDWRNEAKKCELPFNEEYSIYGYSGLYFKLK